jgi:hypothetical protein
MAFSKDLLVRISLGRGSPFAASLPVNSPIRNRCEEFAGAVADPRGDIPSASVMQAIVDAVPMTPHV